MPTTFDYVSPSLWVGAARFRTLFDSEEYDLVESVQPSGEQTPLHRHTYVEHLFVAAGSVDAWVEDRRSELRPGDTLSVPAGAAHALRMGADGARGVVSSRPGRFAKFIAAVGTPDQVPPDLDALARKAAEFGDELLGPPGVLPHHG